MRYPINWAEILKTGPALHDKRWGIDRNSPGCIQVTQGIVRHRHFFLLLMKAR